MKVFIPLQQCLKTRKSSSTRKHPGPLDLVKQRLGEFDGRNLQAAFDDFPKYNRSQIKTNKNTLFRKKAQIF
jgi:hypothetical protein